MPTEKQYELNDCKLTVLFDKKLIRIADPESLKEFLSNDIEVRSEVLVNAIKMDYLKLFNVALAVSNDSMIVEIWGHVYASYFARAIKGLIKMKLIEEVADFIINRSDTIDCGESEIDLNRKFWDLFANFKGIILTFLPKRLKAK